MKKQTIMWTALPNGVFTDKDGTLKLRLSVFVSPRLTTEKASTLSDFPDFLDWPRTLFPSDPNKHVHFKVQFGSMTPVDAKRVGDLPDSNLWTTLFSDKTYVEPHKFTEYQDRPIQSYPIRNVQQFLKKQYANVAAYSGEEFPSASSLLGEDAFLPIAFIPEITRYGGEDEEKLTKEIIGELGRNKAIPPAPPNINPSKDFLQVKLFHQPFTTNRLEKIPIPSIDFHRMISLLGGYPVLLRIMGLVHDLEVPFPDTIEDTTVQVIAYWTSQDDTGVETVNIPNSRQCLMTSCHIDRKGFYALSSPGKSGEVVDGMLPFDHNDLYEVVQIDPDGAALKALNFAKNLAIAQMRRRTDDTPENYSVPSLRSGGISVARVGRAVLTHEGFKKQTDNNKNIEDGSDTTLYAEDIIRGYAIDVWDSVSNRWHSLCQRVGTYKFGNPDPVILLEEEDEGWISASVTSAAAESDADGSSDILRQGESLFRWKGWSLVAPRPGKTIDQDGNPIEGGTEVHPDFNLWVHFNAKPSSLPRLRYGVTYRLRARAVDLAGNRRPLDNTNDHATNELMYGRFEPVPPPVVVMRYPRTEGESVDRLIIRSNFDTSSGEGAARHIAPPKTSQSMAEEHGLFDDPNTGRVDANAYSLITSKEAGSISDIDSAKFDPDNYDQPYIDADSFELPYLPDPFSRGAAFRDLSGKGSLPFHQTPLFSKPFLVDFPYAKGKWPDAQPFLLRLVEGEEAKAEFYSTERVLIIYLPKAEMARVRLSSYMDSYDAKQMGLVKWVEDEKGSQERDEVMALATEGQHWMLTPYRVLTLVHAVRQPLLAPEFSSQFKMERAHGSTFATLHDRMMRVSRKSTVQVDVLAEWDEWVDPLDMSGPMLIHGSARPFILPVPLAEKPEEEETVTLVGRHEFGDTKYRAVYYSAVATTRFGEYFLQRRKDVQLKDTIPFILDKEGVVEGSEAVRNLADGTPYKRYDPKTNTGDYVMDYVNGTIRRTGLKNAISEPDSTIPEDEVLEVTYIVPPITRETANPTKLDILSSARPAAPKVLYVIPTFSWKTLFTGPGKRTTESRRRGNSIRIYLERPWFSSGDGELLGVVLWPGPANISLIAQPPPERAKPYITQWGLDPVFKSKQTDPRPTLAAFKLSKPEHQAIGLSLEETPHVDGEPDVKVDVAGHEVFYDQERRLWYCDMVIDAGQSYFPFIRLALARYQPKSLPKAITGPDTVVDPNKSLHLSRVVLADFIQLAPDRFASITRDATKKGLFHVSVTGRSYQTLTGLSGPSKMEVSLEKRRQDISPDTAKELAWEPVFWEGGEVKWVLASTLDKAGNTVWTGDITLPSMKGYTGPLRLIIKEFELYQGTQRRLVYADAIEINP